MARIKAQCPHCGTRYWIEDDFLGERTECDLCHLDFAVTALERRDRVWAGGSGPAQPDLGALMANDTPEIVLASLDMALVRVEPGSFQCGSQDGYQCEKPPHRVRISRGFWIGRHPVTQAQFRGVMLSNPSYFRGDRQPVESVCWQDAHEFCSRLTALQRAGGGLPGEARFRLPTEAEWEYACKTEPTGRPAPPAPEAPLPAFCSCHETGLLEASGWYAGNSQGHTHPVGLKRPNRRGLYDMHGNVGEWCLDWFAPYPPEEQTDPKGPPDGDRKVRRGGGWSSCPRRCRATDRLGIAPECRSGLLGFRLVLCSV